jgi:hypothetical protein
LRYRQYHQNYHPLFANIKPQLQRYLPHPVTSIALSTSIASQLTTIPSSIHEDPLSPFLKKQGLFNSIILSIISFSSTLKKEDAYLI